MKKHVAYAGLLGVLVVSGCFTGTTPVTQKFQQEATKNAYLPKLRVVEGVHEARNIDKDDPGARAAIKGTLEKTFYAKDNFTRVAGDGPDVLTAEYRIIFFNPGDRGSRFFSSGISRGGDGTVIIETTFKNQGALLAKFETQASVVLGTFGGNLSATYDRVARDINTYARNHFLDSTKK